MKTAWQVRRTTRAGTDGERRWDYAYQFLLQWAMADGAGVLPAPVHYKCPQQNELTNFSFVSEQWCSSNHRGSHRE